MDRDDWIHTQASREVNISYRPDDLALTLVRFLSGAGFMVTFTGIWWKFRGEVGRLWQHTTVGGQASEV